MLGFPFEHWDFKVLQGWMRAREGDRRLLGIAPKQRLGSLLAGPMKDNIGQPNLTPCLGRPAWEQPAEESPKIRLRDPFKGAGILWAARKNRKMTAMVLEAPLVELCLVGGSEA